MHEGVILDIIDSLPPKLRKTPTRLDKYGVKYNQNPRKSGFKRNIFLLKKRVYGRLKAIYFYSVRGFQ